MSQLLKQRPSLILPRERALILPERSRSNRSRLDRLPAPWVRRYEPIEPAVMTAAFGAAGTLSLGDTGGTTGAIATYPAGITANQLLLYFVFCDSGLGQTTQWSTAPSGYTVITSTIAGRRSSGFYWKLASGSETGTASVQPSSFTSGAGSSFAQIVQYTNNATASPIAGSSAGQNNGSSSSCAFGNFTATANDALVVAVCGVYNTGTIAAPSGASLTWTQDSLTTNLSDSMAWGSATLAASGAVNTVTVALGTSGFSTSAQLAIKPASTTVSPSFKRRSFPQFNR